VFKKQKLGSMPTGWFTTNWCLLRCQDHQAYSKKGRHRCAGGEDPEEGNKRQGKRVMKLYTTGEKGRGYGSSLSCIAE